MTTTCSPISLSRLWKRTRSSGSRPGGGFVDNDQPGDRRSAPGRCRSAASCRRRRCRGADCGRPTGWSGGAAYPPGARRAARFGNALELGEVVQQAPGSHFRVEAELLRQVAEQAADGVLFTQHVDVVEESVPPSASCSVARVRISVDLPAPFGPSSPNIPCGW